MDHLYTSYIHLDDIRLGKFEIFLRNLRFVTLWRYRTLALDQPGLRVLCRILHNATAMEISFKPVPSRSSESRRSIRVSRSGTPNCEGPFTHYHNWKRKPFATLKVINIFVRKCCLVFFSFWNCKTTNVHKKEHARKTPILGPLRHLLFGTYSQRQRHLRLCTSAS